ncbi:Uncharacterized protein TCM_011747 [Theobroma cacao]|uniref:Uncharacterized protein n=1 Tax=Theobroma cacao TaxID=3641 RepID=A0A061EBE1_THECC|nr:Uncharacterized protein TCM_011747 [Theobroma cacao]
MQNYGHMSHQIRVCKSQRFSWGPRVLLRKKRNPALAGTCETRFKPLKVCGEQKPSGKLPLQLIKCGKTSPFGLEILQWIPEKPSWVLKFMPQCSANGNLVKSFTFSSTLEAI